MRPISLGQAVYMGHIRSDLLGGADDGRRWRRARGDDFQALLEPDAMRRAILGQAANHNRRAAQMRNALLLDLLDNLLRIDLPLADITRAGRRHRPGKTPSVAMKQRHGPEIDRPRVQAVL